MIHMITKGRGQGPRRKICICSRILTPCFCFYEHGRNFIYQLCIKFYIVSQTYGVMMKIITLKHMYKWVWLLPSLSGLLWLHVVMKSTKVQNPRCVYKPIMRVYWPRIAVQLYFPGQYLLLRRLAAACIGWGKAEPAIRPSRTILHDALYGQNCYIAVAYIRGSLVPSGLGTRLCTWSCTVRIMTAGPGVGSRNYTHAHYL